MLECTTNPEIRRVFRLAHEERARAIRDAWTWVFSFRWNGHAMQKGPVV